MPSGTAARLSLSTSASMMHSAVPGRSLTLRETRLARPSRVPPQLRGATPLPCPLSSSFSTGFAHLGLMPTPRPPSPPPQPSPLSHRPFVSPSPSSSSPPPLPPPPPPSSSPSSSSPPLLPSAYCALSAAMPGKRRPDESVLPSPPFFARAPEGALRPLRRAAMDGSRGTSPPGVYLGAEGGTHVLR